MASLWMAGENFKTYFVNLPLNIACLSLMKYKKKMKQDVCSPTAQKEVYTPVIY